MWPPDPLDLHDFKVVRLNNIISPVDEFERAGYLRLGIEPALVEANQPEEMEPWVAGCHAILVVSAALPERTIVNLQECRVICRLGVGVDKIDVAAATRQGILVTNVPGCFSTEMAEHTMALILALARKLPQMQNAVRQGDWRHSRQLSVQNQRLSECVLGLVGFGDSARDLARVAQAFGMRVLATSRRWRDTGAEAGLLGVEMVDMDSLLGSADYLSLHLPLNAETYHLIDAQAFHKMKPGACLINTARGAIVDEAALVEALAYGHLGGAGLDTVESIDPFKLDAGVPDSPLLKFENVIVTPHVAALSEQGMRAVTVGGLQNLAAVLSGFWPETKNVVNPEVKPRFPLARRDGPAEHGE